MVVGFVVVALGGVVVVRLLCGVGGLVLGVPLVLFLVPLMHTYIFCQFGEKDLAVDRFLTKKIFSLPIPKIKFNTPPQWKNALGFIF